jgi:hypothetical protein
LFVEGSSLVLRGPRHPDDPTPEVVALHPRSVFYEEERGSVADVCTPCINALARQKPPPCALARFDPGILPPRILDLGELTVAERKLISAGVVLCSLVTLGHARCGSGRRAAT